MTEIALRTGAWYGDELLTIPLPAEWDVTVHWPATPPPLTDEQIGAALARPVGQPPLSELCRGKRSPVVIVDDLNRPTPAYRAMPAVLEQFERAGIRPEQVRILIATGTHAPSPMEAAKRKVGPEAARRCDVIVHNALEKATRIGRTSVGTPIDVDRVLADSDFVLGIGGIYPNHTAGFGGGSKLALGVLGLQSIMHLHYRHRPAGWSRSPECSFRRELDEIASAIGLRTIICLHIDANRDVIRATSGDHSVYYRDEVSFARRTYLAPEPGAADVVISNAYPNDVSLTFAAIKGAVPLSRCAPRASQIAIASCSEGMGRHELVSPSASLAGRVRHILRRVSIMTPGEFAGKVVSRCFHPTARPATQVNKWPIWMYRPRVSDLPLAYPGVIIRNDWPDIIDAVRKEQGDGRTLKVAVYPCAPLQCLEAAGESLAPAARRSHAAG